MLIFHFIFAHEYELIFCLPIFGSVIRNVYILKHYVKFQTFVETLDLLRTDSFKIYLINPKLDTKTKIFNSNEIDL